MIIIDSFIHLNIHIHPKYPSISSIESKQLTEHIENNENLP